MSKSEIQTQIKELVDLSNQLPLLEAMEVWEQISALQDLIKNK